MNTCAVTLLLPESLQADLLTAQQIEDAEGHRVTVTGLCNVQANKAVLEAMQVSHGGWAHGNWRACMPTLPGKLDEAGACRDAVLAVAFNEN